MTAPRRADDPVFAPVGIHELARRFGRRVSAERALLVHLDWLERDHDFPPPLPSRTRRHRYYDRRAVDAWFDARVPVNLRELALAADLTTWGVELDARAATLFQPETVPMRSVQ